MASTLSQFDAFLKEYYTRKKIESLTYQERPLLGNLTKEPELSGDVWVTPVIVSNPQGHGATRATAQTGAQQSGTGANVVGRKWQVTFGDYADSVEIGEKTIAASRNDVGAFLRNQKLEIDTLHEGFADIFGYYVYSDSGFALGSGTISTGVITLANANDACNFEPGQILVASADDGTSTSDSLIGAPSLGYVIAVNRGTGTVTVSDSSGGSAATPTSWTGTMFFFRNGDFGGTASPNRIILGLGAWIPSSDPGATSFEGVDRTLDITRLSGVRLPAADIASMGIEQRIKLLATRMQGRAGSKRPTSIYLHTEKWQALADSLESRGAREIGEAGKFGYIALKLATAGGHVDVFSDRFCPSGAIWALNEKFISLGSYDAVPHVVNGDGLQMLRKSTSDDYEYRLISHPAFCVSAPGHQGRVSAP